MIAASAAMMMTGLLLTVGLTTDLGSVFFEKRRLQAATDAAAMAAAQDPTNAMTIAQTVLTANGFANAKINSLTTGAYAPNSSIPWGSRFTPNAVPANAVSLATSVSSPLFFARAVMSYDSVNPKVSAIGYQQNEAGLVAGSGLANLNGGLENAILGSLLGANLSLNVNSYQGLANTNISALGFVNALATQLNLTAGTYSQVLASNVSMQSVLAAELSVLSQQGQLTGAQLTAYQALQWLSASLTGSPTINVGSLIDVGTWQNAQVGTINNTSALAASFNLLQLNSFAAQIANGSNFLSLNNATSIPGVANVNVAMTEIEPVQGSYYALGPVGLSVHTSQVRLLLTLNLLSALQVGATSAPVSLEVYTEVAYGNAATTSIACGPSPSSDTTVGVAAQSGVANEYVGNVTQAAMSNFTQPVTVGSAPIVNVAGLVTVSGTAQVPVQGNTADLLFDQAEIQALTPQTVSSTNMLSNMGNGLQSNLHLTGAVLGIPLPPTGATTVALNSLLQPAFAALDTVVDSTLNTLGVQVGYMNVTVTGARCGVPTLVR